MAGRTIPIANADSRPMVIWEWAASATTEARQDETPSRDPGPFPGEYPRAAPRSDCVKAGLPLERRPRLRRQRPQSPGNGANRGANAGSLHHGAPVGGFASTFHLALFSLRPRAKSTPNTVGPKQRAETHGQLDLAPHLAALLGSSDDAFDVAASGYDYPPTHGHRRRRAKVDMIALFSVLRVHFIDERQQDARPRRDRYVGRRARRGPLRQHRLRRVATRLG